MSGDLRLVPGAPGTEASDSDAPDGEDDVAALESLGIVAPPAERAITPLGALLVERGDLSGQQLRDALGAQTSGGKRLGEILVEVGVISERVLSSALAEQVGLETVDLARARPDIAIVGLLTPEEARTWHALPLRKVGGRIDVAIADALDPELQSKLIARLHSPVRLLVAPAADVAYAIERAYLNQAEISGALKQFAERSESRSRQADTVGADVAVDENSPIVKVVSLIFEQAVRDRGSDVHIEPQQDRVRVRVRTDGALHEILSLPVSMAAALVSRIKVMADMNIVERRRPQDGQIELSVDGHDLDVRVSTTATVFGEKCVMRLLDRTRAVLTMAQLGMSDETRDVYERLIRSPYGMVICAGPTGAGKTTTLYATLAAIDREEINIMTIEDPVEYVFPAINQIQINPLAGVTFANGLKAILRQDPDAILVGEIRDVETARIAVQAALTGHFVMSSLHATDATSALHRFMDMGIEPFLIASSLLGVVGQRLIRKICENCKGPYAPTPDERSFYDLAGGHPDNTEFVRGAGCNVCGQTGYYDRVGIYEVLPITDSLKELVVARASLAALREAAVEVGMRTLRDQAVDLVEQKLTTIAEVLRTVYVL
ncbi:MAG: pilus biosynthesis protein PilB [Actinomycetia bacterium]|jgi:type IV pilus assembly protein PilB|nr:pilus biosynthesis protein PilB [Actinomycetes bacterium]